MAGGKTESATSGLGTSCEERLENPGCDLSGDAGTVIRNAKDEKALFHRGADSDPPFGLVAQSVSSVANKVQDNLKKLMGTHLNLRLRRPKLKG